MSLSTVGLVGFGEAGRHLARGMVASGQCRVRVYDRLFDDPDRSGALPDVADEVGAERAASLYDLVEGSEVILSVVVAGSALDLAREIAPLLGPQHLYVDLNSVSPACKTSMGALVAEAGARYAAGAMMGPLPRHGHRVPTLLSGPDAQVAGEQLRRLGMQPEVLGSDPGSAAAIKMFRSVLIKGVEALLFECLSGARSYGVHDRVLRSTTDLMGDFDWPAWADYTLARMAAHAGRRSQELDEAARTLADAGVDPLVTRAAAAQLRRVAELGPLQTGPGYVSVLEAVAAAASTRPSGPHAGD